MYNSDKPIKDIKDDLLGRSYFAKQLSKAILNFEQDDSIVIGMFGKWGTGKTSIINMALYEIENQTLDKNYEEKPIIIKFEPWNFSDNDNLITQFFHCFRQNINLPENSKFKEKVGEALENYSECLEFSTYIPPIAPFTKILKKSISLIGKRMKNKNSNTSLEQSKNNLEKTLKKQNKKIVVIIDDIDRLDNKQIRMIFQLVKQVASFPNTTYVLSMDKDIVIRALEDIQKCDGNEYLEKIIQIPFNIPELDKSKIQDFLFHRLDNIISNKNDAEFDNEHWGEVYRSCIYPYINTIRDVNRLINTFQFKYDIVSSEVDFADMIGITTLEVTQPTLFNWILENRDSLLNLTSSELSNSFNKKEITKKEYLDIFSKMNLNADLAISAISSLFPKFSSLVNSFHSYVDEKELRAHMRIGSKDRFDLYFKLNIQEIAITRSILKESIYNSNEEQLSILLKQINEKGKIIDYLEELRSKTSDIPYERISMFIKVLYTNKPFFIGDKNNSFLSFDANRYAEFCISDLAERLLSTKEKADIYLNLIENANIHILEGMCEDINRIELGYGRLAGKNLDESKQTITLEELNEIEKAFVERINFLATIDTIFEAKSLLFVNYFWESFDLKSCEEYFLEKLKDDYYKLKFICKLSTSWVGTGGKGFSFYEENYNKYLTKEQIYSLIQSYNKETLVDIFTPEDVIKLAFFILNHDTSKEHVTEKEAKLLVEKWNSIKI